MQLDSPDTAREPPSSTVAPRSAHPSNVVIVTTVMLSFISFWRAAAIVLSDLASSAYYVGGIAESAIGKSAPWFILAIMLFSYAVRAVYIESCSMFVRGGVYRVVREALGGTLAKVSVSALLFDYVLTGPISAVSAGLYVTGLVKELGERAGLHLPALLRERDIVTAIAVIIMLYFWRKNVLGMHESSQKALRIMQITTVMVVMLIGWSLLTMLLHGFQPVPFPSAATLNYSKETLGWLRDSELSSMTAVIILVGLGHSLLAMSGEESLAQVNREIAHPKLKNLERAGLVIFLYSLTFTSLVSFFAVMLIPDEVRPQYLDNLIGGVSIFLAGPPTVKLVFHGFVVLVGALILSGAVNTAIIGSNGVLNRVAEDGVLPDWFRHPHPRYGTTSRTINLIVGLQIFTIIISHGNIYLLGEAYAFGVVWSFTLKALSVLVLRYKMPDGREWKVPLNFRLGGRELPLGLALITLGLFSLATINLFTKEAATVAGILFSAMLFVVFELTERYNKRYLASEPQLEKFRFAATQNLELQTAEIRPQNILVAVRNPNRLVHLERVLAETNTSDTDVVVLSIHRLTAAGSGEHGIVAEQAFGTPEREVFTKVVSRAERLGKHVSLLVVPAVDVNFALLSAAQRLQSRHIVLGSSSLVRPVEQAIEVGRSWEQLPQPRLPLSLRIIEEDGTSRMFPLGPHAPGLTPEDIELNHRLWLQLRERGFGSELHHRDVLHIALLRLSRDLEGDGREIADELRRELRS